MGICGGTFGLIGAFNHGSSNAEEIGAALPLMLDTFLSRLAVDGRQRVKGAASCNIRDTLVHMGTPSSVTATTFGTHG